ncbi:MAG: hypothetical protein AAGB12_10085 [Pseudomonadota bacterium]
MMNKMTTFIPTPSTSHQASPTSQASLDLGKNPENNPHWETTLKKIAFFTKIFMTVIVTFFILVFFGYALILSENKELQKISAGFIGTVIGYWLK